MGASVSSFDGSLREDGLRTAIDSRKPTSLRESSLRTDAAPAVCPIDHTKMSRDRPGRDSPLNPLNRMPELSQLRSEGQKSALPVQREISSIPRRQTDAKSACPVPHATSGDAKTSENWQYPSPQQFYNALVRKGKEAPEESVEMMVQIHNWLNESAWNEVRRWEETRTPGQTPELARFEGKPDNLSPKARWHLMLAKVFPNSYSSMPPFDRHDWQVARADGSLHRYVIDYYAGPNDDEGQPVFFLDVRPALDSADAVYWRLKHWSQTKFT